MSLEFAHGAIQWLTADSIGTVYSVGGLTFKPMGIRFYWLGIQSTTSTEAASHLRDGIGFFASDGAGGGTRRCVGSFSENGNVAGSNCGSVATDQAVVITVDGSGVVDGSLDLNEHNPNGFSVIVDDVAPANLTVFWEAWGGSDITLAVVGNLPEPTITGLQEYTVTGFVAGGTDQVVMFAGCQSSSALGTGAAESSGISTGFATGPGALQVVVNFSSDDASATTDTRRYCFKGECLAMIARAGGNPTGRAIFTGFMTNGFELDWLSVATTNRRNIFLALKGGNWRVGSFIIDSTTLNATATVSGLPFIPKGLCLIGTSDDENAQGVAGVDEHAKLGSGSSVTSRRALDFREHNAVTTSAIFIAIKYDAIVVRVNSSGVREGVMDIDAMNSDGFRIIIDELFATGQTDEWFGYLTFGNASENLMGQVWAQ